MNALLECRKVKRTALLPALLLGGVLSAAFPVVLLLVREDAYIHLPGKPLDILFSAGWPTMTLINVFLIVLGACILYHVEFSGHAIQRMDTLPLRPGGLIVGKFVLLSLSCVVVFALEGAALYFCAARWFRVAGGFLPTLTKAMAYSFLLTLPVVSVMLLISSLCQNMWVTLGIGVIGVFAAEILVNFKDLRYFPFQMPYQVTAGGHVSPDATLSLVAAGETLLFLTAGIVLTKVRRNAA